MRATTRGTHLNTARQICCPVSASQLVATGSHSGGRQQGSSRYIQGLNGLTIWLIGRQQVFGDSLHAQLQQARNLTRKTHCSMCFDVYGSVVNSTSSSLSDYGQTHTHVAQLQIMKPALYRMQLPSGSKVLPLTTSTLLQFAAGTFCKLRH